MIREGPRLEKSANLIQLLYHNFGSNVKKKTGVLVLFKRADFPPPAKAGGNLQSVKFGEAEADRPFL